MIKLKDKKGFLARDWIISLILFSGLVGIMVLMVASHADTYGNTDIIDSAIEDDLLDIDETVSISNSMFASASDKSSYSVFTAFGILFNSAFTIISLVFNSISLAGNQLFSFTEHFGVPTAIANILFPMFISVLTVVLVFVIISTTTRRDF